TEFKSSRLLLESKSEIFFPKYITSTALESSLSSQEVQCPEVNLLVINNCVVSGSCSSFILNELLFIEQFGTGCTNNHNYSSGGLISHNNSFAVVKQKELNYIDSGFYLGGNGSWNYYHWLIEILPKLEYYLSRGLHSKGVPLLLPSIVEHNTNFKFLLDSILGTDFDNINYIPSEFCTVVRNLYHVTPVNNILFNERILGLELSTLFIRFESLSYLVSSIERYVGDVSIKSETPERIFLARNNSLARSYNQNELIKYLLTKGFEVVHTEDLDIKQQVSLFRNAKYIVGPSGASWANLLFCNPDNKCKALSWLPETIRTFPAFSTLAKFSGVELAFFQTSSDDAKNFHGKYQVDIETFKSSIEAMLEIRNVN
ncbi:DUF563 domain-containing protein, partial [Shewanella sp. 10N.286.45.A1]|uniref:glycosyltransferase family 61 protein n=1 Tax=Shewanella sp. 10N.286.45.A1 TaxID=3229694 RepID=UPI0035545967